jgi:PAS domain S-box-containing protein
MNRAARQPGAPKLVARTPRREARGLRSSATARILAQAVTAEHPPAAHPDLPELLQHAVDELARLLHADGAFIDLLDAETGLLHWAYEAGTSDESARAALRDVQLPIGQGIFGMAVARREVTVTGDYLADDRFPHAPGPDRWAEQIGLRSVVAAPIVAADEPFGALGAYSSTGDAFKEAEIALVAALAGHISAAIANSRLIAELEASESQLARRAESERALREIAARIGGIQEPARVLQQVVDESVGLLGSDGAIIYLLDEATGVLRWAHDAGISGAGERRWVRRLQMPVGAGIFGRAVAERRAVLTADYPVDESFVHTPPADRVVREVGIRSMAVAPLLTGDRPVGALGVYATRQDAYGSADLALLQTLADNAATAIANARLIEELGASRAELARRVEAEQALRAITGRITALRDPAEVLQLVVDEAARLLGADGARIDLVDAGSGALHWAFGHSGIDRELELSPGEEEQVDPSEGISGRAVIERRVVVSGDYLADQSFLHRPWSDRYVREHGIRSVLAAPLSADSGAIGALTIHAGRVDAFDEDDAQLAGALADQAAIAVTAARLYDQLLASERRYRHLVENSPDVVVSLDAAGRFTYISETIERITAYHPDELIGRHFTMLLFPDSMDQVSRRWAQLKAEPSEVQRVRFFMRDKEGSPHPVEVTIVGETRDGRFSGANGAVRDVSESEQLERELRGQAAALAAAEERAHLARELHDSVTQALFSMTLTTRAVELLLARDPTAAAAKLGELRELQRDALAEMRGLIFELRPGSLEQDGLVQALRTHAAAVQGRSGLPIDLDVRAPERLPLQIEDTLFRISQEALHNAVKHAAAHQARVELGVEGGVARLSVSDDGIGFDEAAVGSGRVGLASMRARAERLGGRLTVASVPGQGTTVEVSLPVDATGPVVAPARPAGTVSVANEPRAAG